ncbi:Rha family transcriptional regulator [Vreelandella populi]|uniref:Rha family transcriptional regulator n=1 Tax=Vreelandella populi TaxID=2498858 RepID=UPI000F8D9BAE|nr:Rha family transcriptional regulator [Halomonas populi]RUR52692.1 hypothetical protein ELY40_11620 [Halomonas populi]
MNELIKIDVDGNLYVSSLTVSEEFGRRHDNVLTSIRDLIASRHLGALDFKESSYRSKQNKEMPCILLSHRGFLISMPYIGGEKSKDGQVRLVDSFIEKSEELERLRAVKYAVLESPAEWEKRFVDRFYQALGKMTNLPFAGHIGGTPALFGKITKDWVYRVALDDEIYQAAKERAGSAHKIHQVLSDSALRRVEKQMDEITTLANSCVDYQDFIARCSRMYGVKGQLRIIYPAAA